MNLKKCPFCDSNQCIKKGFQEGYQRWKCNSCNKKFQANRKALPPKEELFCLYVFNKQTLNELSDEYHAKREVFQEMFDSVSLKKKVHEPRIIALCVDTTFFGEFGVVVFRDQKKKENLWWMFVEEERLEYYHRGFCVLLGLGYTIASVTADGLPGLPNVFKGIPFQYCHFHAKKTITTYTTKRPQTTAGKEILGIMFNLKSYTHSTFVQTINQWHKRHELFLKERTVHPDGRWSYTHRRLRAAIRSMIHMSSYLFTYLENKTLHIPATTNTLEGHFAHIKVRCGVHRGISEPRMKKLIHTILLASSSSYKKDLPEKLF
jgi:hypothetical protein